MIGVVEVYRGNQKILEEPNMIMDQLGNQIAFWMSLPRGFSNIPEAANLYDTSNYTVRAASLGKDAASYNLHAHGPLVSGLIVNDGILRVYSYEGSASTSYRTEKTARYYVNNSYYSGTVSRYDILPEDSHPKMTRLEEKSTKVNAVSGSLDLGHNLNLAISGNAYKPAGCYAPSGNSTLYLWSSIPNINAAAGNTINNTNGFNSAAGQLYKSIDSRGFIRVTHTDLADGYGYYNSGNYFRGLLIRHSGLGLHNDYEVIHTLGIRPADFLYLNFFGGIYTMGLWGFDVQKMLNKGMNPPFSQYNIEDIDYKLFARKTFNKDLTYYEGTTNSFSEVSALEINWKFKFA